MIDEKRNDAEELTELRHEAKPGYRVAFLIVFAIAIIYTAIIFSTDGRLNAGHGARSGAGELHRDSGGSGNGH